MVSASVVQALPTSEMAPLGSMPTRVVAMLRSRRSTLLDYLSPVGSRTVSLTFEPAFPVLLVLPGSCLFLTCPTADQHHIFMVIRV